MLRCTSFFITLSLVAPATLAQQQFAASATALRPPAVPLVAHDPYFSVWSMGDRLTDSWSKHWTGANQAICGLVRIDGKTYRYAGPDPREAEPMTQTALELTPTRTTYAFEAGGITLALTFLTPALPTDLDLLSRPITYVTWTVASRDEKPHDVTLHFDASGEWCVDRPHQHVVASRWRNAGSTLLRIGTQEQRPLSRAGDDLRIDWGYFYVSVPNADGAETAIAGDKSARGHFIDHAAPPAIDDTRFPRAANDDWPVLACTFALGQLGSEAVTRRVLLAYDDQFSIEFFHRKLRPYWARTGVPLTTLLRQAVEDYEKLDQRCREFDAELTADLTKIGGRQYADLAVLAYRQTLAAHKLAADFDGTPLMFSKENFSNGCIATVDVIYPASPFFLLLSPAMMKAQLLPVLEYARSARWQFPFAPHDLGTYPLANGQVYGGGELTEQNQMPVEESANMILMLAALARLDGKAELARRYATQVRQWAEYLADHGVDPTNQLCTDDFAGHLARNANLSLKAIVALGAYAEINHIAKREDDAATYRRMAETAVAEWMRNAADGDHYRLAFDKPDSWSQKYNLVWDRVLDLKLFPPEVVAKEIAYYKTRQNAFGLPLDNRADYTKLDWCIWTASLAQERADFEALVSPLWNWANETPTRVPLTDWFDTKTGKQVGFQARSVVGGVYMPMLTDAEMWKKWAGRGASASGR